MMAAHSPRMTQMLENVRVVSAAPARRPSGALIADRHSVGGTPRAVTTVAWLVILATSLLPTVIAQEVLGASVTLTERTAAAAAAVRA